MIAQDLGGPGLTQGVPLKVVTLDVGNSLGHVRIPYRLQEFLQVRSETLPSLWGNTTRTQEQIV